MKSAIDIKLEFICKEIKELKRQQQTISQEITILKEDINKGKGAVWLLIFLATIVATIYGYFIK